VCDALVDDVALLEEQLPGGDRGADDGDHQQHHVGEFRSGREARDDEIAGDVTDRWMHHQKDRDQQQAEEAKAEGKKRFEAAEAAGAGGGDDDPGGDQNAQTRGNPRKPSARLMPMNSVTIVNPFEDEQVDDAERPPELPKALQDEPRVAATSDRAEAKHHFLIDVKAPVSEAAESIRGRCRSSVQLANTC